MTAFGFAKKIGMTRLFVDNKATPVTALQLGDNSFLQIKTDDKDGYNAVQVAAFPRPKAKNSASKGHVAKNAKNKIADDFYCMTEFRDAKMEEGKTHFEIGDITEGESYDIAANTIGRGFTGPVKRYNFRGAQKSHGHDHVRRVGSIGDTGTQRVNKGQKMAGRHGGTRHTAKNLKVVGVDAEQGLFFVAGSVPGPNSAYVQFSPAKNS